MLNYIIWDFDPVLIDSFISLRWYSLMFLIGFLVGYKIVEKMFKHEGAPEKWLGSLLLWVMAGTIVGARLGHVFFYAWDYYSQHPIEILYTWEGGLASHGGAIGVIIAVLAFSKFTAKHNALWTFDKLVKNHKFAILKVCACKTYKLPLTAREIFCIVGIIATENTIEALLPILDDLAYAADVAGFL